MTYTKGNIKKRKVDSPLVLDIETIIICKHCQKQIEKVRLIGFSLICPSCGKPQNGQPCLKK